MSERVWCEIRVPLELAEAASEILDRGYEECVEALGKTALFEFEEVKYGNMDVELDALVDASIPFVFNYDAGYDWVAGVEFFNYDAKRGGFIRQQYQADDWYRIDISKIEEALDAGEDIRVMIDTYKASRVPMPWASQLAALSVVTEPNA